MSAEDAIRAYYRYAITYGTPPEKEAMAREAELLFSLRSQFPDAAWEPMDHVILIAHAQAQATDLGRRRFATAHRQHYKDYQGKIGRTVEEEIEVTKAHFAAQFCLGLPLGQPSSKEEARVVGNIGGNNEAFVPLHNPYGHHLIVDPRTPDHILCWLVVPEGSEHYRLTGYMRAVDAKVPEYQRKRQREGGTSIAYWVPPNDLAPIQSYWL